MALASVAVVAASGCGGDALTERDARNAVDALLSMGEQLPDNCCPPAQLTEWRGLVQSGETEFQAKAVINHNDGRMTGAFIFHKAADGGWVLDRVEFREPERALGGYWREDVFQKVE